MIWRLTFLLVLPFFLVLPMVTSAEDYPSKPISVISPFAVGGMVDLVARAFAPVAEQYLGKPVVVVTKPGAAGALGYHYTAQAKPDGYTLCIGCSAQTQVIVGDVLTGKRPSFNIDDFVVLGRFCDTPNVFLVPYGSHWKTMRQVIDEVKANPNRYAFSSGGIYSTSHLPMEILMGELKLKLRHVPFQGGGPALNALIGGHVDFSAQSAGTSIGKIKAKQLRALAQFGEKRYVNYEDVPTFKELGYDVVYSAWFGLSAQKETPSPIVEKLRNLVKQVSSDPAFMDVIDKVGDQVNYADAETTKKNWDEEYHKMLELLGRLEKEKK
jgi:tripartite-type tricarboxylate transporter receptor subunit TctC